MKNRLTSYICSLGILASLFLGVMSLPSRFMATPMESKAHQIMKEGLKHDIDMTTEQSEIVIMSHYAESNIEAWVFKARVMFLSAGVFFTLFLWLLLLSIRNKSPNQQVDPIVTTPVD